MSKALSASEIADLRFAVTIRADRYPGDAIAGYMLRAISTIDALRQRAEAAEAERLRQIDRAVDAETAHAEERAERMRAEAECGRLRSEVEWLREEAVRRGLSALDALSAQRCGAAIRREADGFEHVCDKPAGHGGYHWSHYRPRPAAVGWE